MSIPAARQRNGDAAAPMSPEGAKRPNRHPETSTFRRPGEIPA